MDSRLRLGTLQKATIEPADPGHADVTAPEPGEVPVTTTRPIKWEGMPLSLSERLRKQVLPSLVIIAACAAVVIRESGPSDARHSAAQAPSGASTGALPASHTQGEAKPANATVASCATAWNVGSSPTHRHILDLRVQHDRPAFAVVATYIGPAVHLARLGGGSQVLVAARACIVIARHYVFVQQPSAAWGLVRAQAAYPFVTIARTRGWTPAHANVTVKVGPPRSGTVDIGALTPRDGTLVTLTANDLGRRLQR